MVNGALSGFGLTHRTKRGFVALSVLMRPLSCSLNCALTDFPFKELLDLPELFLGAAVFDLFRDPAFVGDVVLARFLPVLLLEASA